MSVTACGVDECGLDEVAEVAALYARSEGEVRGHVRNGVTAPEAVIEDACQFAWCRLLHHRERVSRDRAVAWLVTTAVHEAFKLKRRAARELSLEALMEETGRPSAQPRPRRRLTPRWSRASGSSSWAHSRSAGGACCGSRPWGLTTARWRCAPAPPCALWSAS